MGNKYEVRCEVDNVETLLGRHRTEGGGRKRFLNMRRLLPEMLRGTRCRVKVWLQDPAKKTVERAVWTADQMAVRVSGPASPVDYQPISLARVGPWAALVDALTGAELTSVVFEYDGSDGHPDMPTMLCHNQDGLAVEIDTELADRVEELCEELLPTGYYDHLGSHGEVTIDVTTRTVRHDHHWRVTSDDDVERRGWWVPAAAATETAETKAASPKPAAAGKPKSVDERVAEACAAAGHPTCHVSYSASEYPEDDEDADMIDNLDEVAVEGKVVLVGAADDYFGGPKSRPYRSEVLESPTWLQVAVRANAMIRKTRDTHHCFLEGLDKKGREGDVTVYEFVMGS